MHHCSDYNQCSLNWFDHGGNHCKEAGVTILIATAKSITKKQFIFIVLFALIGFELIPSQLADMICKSSSMFCKLAPILSYRSYVYFLHNICCIESLSIILCDNYNHNA